MARITTTRYICDACEKEVERPRDLSQVRIINDGPGGRKGWDGLVKMQICDSCVRRFHDLLESFGPVDLSEFIDADELAAI